MSNPAGRPRLYPDVVLLCRHCQEPFRMQGSHARAYEEKHGKTKPYCSMKCFYAATHRHPIDYTEAAPTYICEGCKEVTSRRRDTLNGGRRGNWDMAQKYCSTECFHTSRFAANEAKRASGILPKGHISADGYHVVKVAHGKQLKMHRVAMEKILGRPLRGNENVHHVNGDRADNRPENLELWVKTQPCGQRAIDKVAAALDLIKAYPELAAFAGYELVSTDRDKGRGG